MTVLNFFKSNPWAIWCSIILIILIAFFVMKNHYAQDNVSLTNKLADMDTLHTVIQNENGTLKARIAFVDQNFEAEVKKSALLKEYIKAKDARIDFLVSTVTSFSLENAIIRGILDSAKNGATFDTVTHDYSLKVHTTYFPPLMQVLRLDIKDSTSVGLAQTGDNLLEGFIIHTNKRINDSGASFKYRFGSQVAKTNWVNTLEWGFVGVGVGGVGAGNLKVTAVGVVVVGLIEGLKQIF